MVTDQYNATVVQKVLMTPGLMTLRVRPDEESPDFKPGQYTVLGLGSSAVRLQESMPDPVSYDEEKMIKRAYSISSASIIKEYFEFYISLVRSGQLTPRLFALEQGDRILIGNKAVGMFTLDGVPVKKNLLFISTGTGLAPYMSMLRSELHLHPGRTFVVLHGASCSWDLGYRDELSMMDRLTPTFHYLPTITEPDKDPTWKGLSEFIEPIISSGRLEEEAGMALTPENFDVFLCGNPKMVEGVAAMLESKGFKEHSKKEPGEIHVERFWK